MVKLITLFFTTNKTLLFFFYVLLYVIISLFTEVYVLTDELIYNTLGEQVTAERIQQMLDMQMSYKWVSYTILPLLLLLKYSLVSICLIVAAFFAEDYELSFKKIFGVVLAADIVFIFAAAVKMLWIYFHDFQTLQEISSFFPLSVLNFVSYERLIPAFIYPLQLFNLFEFTYIFLLAFGLAKVRKTSYWKSFEFTLLSYLSGLIIWIIIITFLIVN